MVTESLENHLGNIYEHQETDFRWLNLRRLASRCLKGCTVLDVGCGTGHMTLELLRQGYVVTSIDTSDKLISLTKDFARRNGFQLDARVMDAKDVKKLGKDLFDNILCLDVLEHVEDDTKLLKDMGCILRKSGRLIIVVPALKFLFGRRDKAIGHLRRYTPSELIVKLQNSGLEPIKIRYWNFLGFFPFLIFEKMLHRKIYEGMRYSRKSMFNRYLNILLDRWFYYFENGINFPFGLSLLVIAKRNRNS